LGAVRSLFCICFFLISEKFLLNNQLNDSFGLQLTVAGILFLAAFGRELKLLLYSLGSIFIELFVHLSDSAINGSQIIINELRTTIAEYNVSALFVF